jgi:hypothetical protein
VRSSTREARISSDPGAAEHGRLAAARQRRQQVDYLDAGFKQFALGALIGKRRGLAMNRPARHVRPEGWAMVARLPQYIDQPAEHRLADRHGDRRVGAEYRSAALEAGGASKRHGAHRAGIEMLLNLGDQTAGLIPLDLHCFVDVRQVVFIEGDIHHRTAHGDDVPPIFSPVFGPIFGVWLLRDRRVVGRRGHDQPLKWSVQSEPRSVGERLIQVILIRLHCGTPSWC